MSLAEVNDNQWLAQTPNGGFHATALTYLMRRVLDGLEEVPGTDGEKRTVAEGFVTDVVQQARKGNSAAMNIVFDRMEGKVPSTSVNVNATFTDDERISRIFGLIKRGGSQAGPGEPEPSREGRA